MAGEISEHTFRHVWVFGDSSSEVDAADSQPKSDFRQLVKTPQAFRSFFHIKVENSMHIFRNNTFLHIDLM